jgi:hypothetical protein
MADFLQELPPSAFIGEVAQKRVALYTSGSGLTEGVAARFRGPQASELATLQQPALCEGLAHAIADHQVVEDPDIHQGEGVLEPAGNEFVSLAGFRDPARVLGGLELSSWYFRSRP